MYTAFYKPISILSDRQLGRLFRAIFAYNLSEAVSVEDDIRMAFEFFKNQFDIDESKYQAKIMKCAEGGRKGGNPNFKKGQSNPYYSKNKGEKEDNPTLTKITQDNPTLSQINLNVNVNDNVNVSSNEDNNPHTPNGVLPLTQVSSPSDGENPLTFSEIESGLNTSENTPPPGSAPPPSQKRFVKPSVDEVRAYCTERRNGIDAQTWWDFYESKGWMVGSNHMKDWKSAVRTWEKRNNYANTNYGREKQQRFGATPPDDFAGKGSTKL